MTTVLDPAVISFELPDRLVATAPIETTGKRRDDTRLLVAWRWGRRMVDTTLAELPRFLDPGDVLVVNTSATLPAAVPTEDGRLLHLSGELPRDTGGSAPPDTPGGTGGSEPPDTPGRTGGSEPPDTPGGTGGTGRRWIVELRSACGSGSRPFLNGRRGETVRLPGGASAELLAPFPAGQTGPVRLWISALRLPAPLFAYLDEFGHPIRYGCGDERWPLDAYQTVFAAEPGSAEMPSAARAFTLDLIAALIRRGVVFAPVTLHTGVSSLEASEHPYPERYRVHPATAELVNAARTRGHRVVAVGTTATRAIESTADDHGRVHAASGWTDLLITPRRGVWVVDGLLTGWHEPQASHLQLLEAVAGRDLLERSYAHAIRADYRWHEFGDLHLILP